MPEVLIRGQTCKVYYGTAGATAATLLGGTRDVSFTLEREKIDGSANESNDWRETVAGMRSASISFQVRVKTTDTVVAALQAAFDANTPMAFLVADNLKTVVGTQGFDADCCITSFSRSKPLAGIVTLDITIEPTPSTRSPSWFTAA